MRDIRFVAQHRGGELSGTDHRALMGWALRCTEHALPLASGEIPDLYLEALIVARQWMEGVASTYDAMRASRAVHALARQTADPVMQLLGRCIGQAVATAHMADHCLGPAWYARKIVALRGNSVDDECRWQEAQLKDLPGHLAQLVASSPKFRC